MTDNICIWITGVPGSGKTTLGNALLDIFPPMRAVLLDADPVRRASWPHLGMSEEDRWKNVLGLAYMAKGLLIAGQNVIVACISPLESMRHIAREIIGIPWFLVALKCDQETLRKRDIKGLYAAYDEGRLKGLTGVDAPYEMPDDDETLIINTELFPTTEIVDYIKKATGLRWKNESSKETSKLPNH